MVTSLGHRHIRQLGEAHRRASPASAASRAFRPRGLRTTIAGSVDAAYRKACRGRSFPSGSRALAGEEAIAPGRHRIEGPLPRAALSCAAAARNRVAGTASRWRRKWRRRMPTPDMPIFCASPINTGTALPAVQVRHRSANSSPTVSAPGLAGDAVDRLRLGRHRHPARHRGDPPRRMRRGAVDRRRRFGQRRSADALLAAFGAVDAERSARARPQSRSPRIATASCWPKAPARWCWKAWSTPSPAARRCSASSRLRREGRLISTAPARTRTVAGHRRHPRGARRCRHCAGRDRLYQRARHLDAGKRQDGASRRVGRVRRTHPRASRSRRTSR